MNKDCAQANPAGAQPFYLHSKQENIIIRVQLQGMRGDENDP